MGEFELSRMPPPPTRPHRACPAVGGFRVDWRAQEREGSRGPSFQPQEVGGGVHDADDSSAHLESEAQGAPQLVWLV